MKHYMTRNDCDLSSSAESQHASSTRVVDHSTLARNRSKEGSASKDLGTTMAAERALSVYEILEHILLQLPFLDLYKSQRVSIQWHQLIKRSGNIQQRMFLQPAKAPLLPLTGLPAYSDQPCWVASDNENRSPCLTVFQTSTLTINPITYLVPTCHEKGPQAWITNAWPGSRKPIVEMEIRDKRPGFTHLSQGEIGFDFKAFTSPRRDQSGATWRRALLTQPPITAVEFFSQDVREGGEHHYRMSNLEGITLGDLEDWEEKSRNMHGLRFGRKTLGHWAACGFWIDRLGKSQGSHDSKEMLQNYL